MFYPEDIRKEFTRIEIDNRVGGSQQSYLPDLGGRIVAACLKLEHNSDAPNVIICGNGPKIAKTGEFLANQQETIRVFSKNRSNRREYKGMFKVLKSYTEGDEFEYWVNRSNRDPNEVTRVIELEPYLKNSRRSPHGGKTIRRM